MDTKKCLACGREMAADLDECPQCHLAGQNQLFFSEADFKKWEEKVVIPHRKRLLPQVFSGPDRMLILLGNGDLYAIGNTRSGALGEGLPDELVLPTIIARGVKHVAAAAYMTLLVMNDGTARILGNSPFADRFVCPVPVERAYAEDTSGGAATFRLVGEDGQWYFAGSKGDGLHIQKTLLRQLPELTVSWEQAKEWYTVFPSSYCQERAVREVGPDPENSPEFKELCEQVRREEWFRAYLREYGSDNVEIRLGEPVQTETLATRQVKEETRYWEEQKPQVIERADMQSRYSPRVLKVNKNVYEATPYEETNKTPHIFENCKSQTGFRDPEYGKLLDLKGEEIPVVKALDIRVPLFWTFRRGLFGGFREDRVEACRAYLTADHRFYMFRDKGPLARSLENIADCAVASSAYYKYHHILLVTVDGIVLHGTLEELYRHGDWNHLKELTFE
ncbi:MAG: hypothetical protein IJE08_00090 [Clostridia bacterium]|nr:hypothetical protein [Clostridia bacterium]